MYFLLQISTAALRSMVDVILLQPALSPITTRHVEHVLQDTQALETHLAQVYIRLVI